MNRGQFPPGHNNRRTHGRGRQEDRKRDKAYRTWLSLRARCNSPSSSAYVRYGAKGIKVCERWNSFEKFINDMGDPPTSMHSIERKNNGRGYEPGNCIWLPVSQQARNKGDNRRLSANGETKLMQDWARITGINKTTIFMRLARGWSEQDAITRPVQPWRR